MSTPQLHFELHVAICHGSFHASEHYQRLIDSLKNHGIEAECHTLPTSNPPLKSRDATEGFAQPDDRTKTPSSEEIYPLQSDDAIVFRDVLERLIIDSGKTVLVIAHSAGGWTATEAVTPSLEYQTRKRQGLQGGVLGIFYICAFVLPPAESMDMHYQKTMKPEDFSQEYIFKSWPDQKEGGEITIPFYLFPKDPVEFFYHDLPVNDGKKWASIIRGLPGPQTARLTNISYLRVPCAYLYTAKDRVVTPAEQEDMTEQMKKLGVQLKEFRYDGGHSPQLSWTEGVVKSAIEFVAGIEL